LCIIYKISPIVHLNDTQIIANLFSGEGQNILLAAAYDDILELIFS